MCYNVHIHLEIGSGIDSDGRVGDALGMGRHFALLLFGVFACATSVIWIRESETSPIYLSAYRLLLAALVLSPFWWRDRKRFAHLTKTRWWKQTAPAAFLLGIHFVSWIVGARLTFASNATLLVNMVPLAMPFLLAVAMHERLHRAEWRGTLLAIAGLAVLGLGSYRYSPESLFGDFVCFASMLCYASYLVCGRWNRHLPSIWLYVVPVYFAAGVLCLVVAVVVSLFYPSMSPIGPKIGSELFLILGLSLVPTVIGHSIINFSLKHLRGQTVAVVNLAQFIFASVMAWIFLDELPLLVFYVASILIAGGAVVVIRGSRQHAAKESD